MTAESIGLILAGGKATRFGGRDKGEIIFRERRLIDHVYDRLAPQVDKVIISGPHDYGLGLTTLPDRVDGPQGPAAALFAATHHEDIIKSGRFLTVPVDGPALPLNLWERLFEPHQSTLAQTTTRHHPTFALWQVKDLEHTFERLDMTQSLSLRALVEMCEAKTVMFENEDGFYNINRPGDLEKQTKDSII